MRSPPRSYSDLIRPSDSAGFRRISSDMTTLNEVGVPGNVSPTYKLSENNPDNIHNNALLSEKFSINLDER